MKYRGLPRACSRREVSCWETKRICRWLIKNLPFIGSEICRRPARHSPSANFSFADGKQKICNRQVRRWPTANFSFVIGKFFIFKREIFCRRQMLSFFLTKFCSVSSCLVLEHSSKTCEVTVYASLGRSPKLVSLPRSGKPLPARLPCALRAETPPRFSPRRQSAYFRYSFRNASILSKGIFS